MTESVTVHSYEVYIPRTPRAEPTRMVMSNGITGH